MGGVLATVATMAQGQTMSLDDCVNYALQHNNTIIQRTLSVQNQEVALNSSKMNYLPNVSASVSQGWSFGRSTDMNQVVPKHQYFVHQFWGECLYGSLYGPPYREPD